MWFIFRFFAKTKKKLFFFLVITKNISPHVLKISEILLVLSTRGSTEIFNTIDEIYSVFTSEKYTTSIYSMV